MEGKIPFSDFSNVEMRVGEIKNVEEHPNADKLFVLKVDLGEGGERVIVAGLRGSYSADELIGKKGIFVANLEPVVLRGVKSDGMILAVDGAEGKVVILTPEGDAEVGSKVR